MAHSGEATSPIDPEVKVSLVPLELPGQLPPCEKTYVIYKALHLDGFKAGALSYTHEAIPRDLVQPLWAFIRPRVRQLRRSIQFQSFTDPLAVNHLLRWKTLHPTVTRNKPKREKGGDLGRNSQYGWENRPSFVLWIG